MGFSGLIPIISKETHNRDFEPIYIYIYIGSKNGNPSVKFKITTKGMYVVTK